MSHPLTLLIVGAVLTGFLAPAITRRWQDRQKELEVKTGLVTELSEVTMSILLAIQFVRVRRDQPTALASTEVLTKRQQEFDDAYRAWEVQSAIVGTKLQAYFTGTRIPEIWTALSEAITSFYTLEGQDESTQQDSISALRAQVLALPGSRRKLAANWMGLRDGILAVKSELIRVVLHEPVAGFSSRMTLWSRRRLRKYFPTSRDSRWASTS